MNVDDLREFLTGIRGDMPVTTRVYLKDVGYGDLVEEKLSFIPDMVLNSNLSHASKLPHNTVSDYARRNAMIRNHNKDIYRIAETTKHSCACGHECDAGQQNLEEYNRFLQNNLQLELVHADPITVLNIEAYNVL